MLYFNGEDGECPSVFFIYLVHQNFPQLNQIIYCIFAVQQNKTVTRAKLCVCYPFALYLSVSFALRDLSHL